jgi:hypothetical protein
LRTGEIDWWELPSWDLVPQLAADPHVTVDGQLSSDIRNCPLGDTKN